jgi:hypothetical protein
MRSARRRRRSAWSNTHRSYGVATSTDAPPTPLQLALACVVVSHSPFGPFSASTRWLLQVTGQLPANAQASLTPAE